MTLNQILRRIRRQPAEPELTPEMRAQVEQWNKNLEGWTEAHFEELERRTVAGHEEEIKQALAESDAYMARRRDERPNRK